MLCQRKKQPACGGLLFPFIGHGALDFHVILKYSDGSRRLSAARGRQPKPRAVKSAVETADLRMLCMLVSPRLPYLYSKDGRGHFKVPPTVFGAGDGSRTRRNQLGKLTPYR